jgi:hypothetical protein
MEQQPIHNYCWKCLSIIIGEGVHDAEGHWYCDAGCRREFWVEQRKCCDERLPDGCKGGWR